MIGNLHKVKLPFEPSLIAQKGAYGALKDYPHLLRTLENNKERYEELIKYLVENGFNPIPSVTNFVTIKTGSEEASLFLYNGLLDHGVIIRPLRANLMPDHVRVSLGTKEEMNHFYEAMNEVVPRYKEKFGVK